MNVILGTMNINYPYSSNPNANVEEYQKMIEKLDKAISSIANEKD